MQSTGADSGRARDSFQQRERYTRDVLLMMGTVESVGVALILIGVLMGYATLMETAPAYLLFALTWLAYGLMRRIGGTRAARWGRYFPSALCFAMGLYAFFRLQFAISMLFMAIAIFLAGMLVSRGAQWTVLTASVVITSLQLGLMGRDYFMANVSALIINNCLLVGLSLLQWYYDRQLTATFQQVSAANIDLSAEITRRCAVEEHLAENERQLRRLAENTSDLIAEVGPDGKARYLSPSFCSALGYCMNELLGRNVFDLLHEDDRGRALELAAENARKRRAGDLEMRVRHVDGHYIWYQAVGAPVYSSEGALDGFVISSRDISAKKAATEALRQSEEKFFKAFQTSPDAININRMSDGLYIDVNEGFTQLTGFTREEVQGRTSFDINIWADPADRIELVRRLKTTGLCENLEAHFRLKGGTVKTGLMSARVMEINGEMCILSFTRDITERIESLRALREAHELLEHAYADTLQGWVRALELREHETADHSRRVVDLTLRMARALGVSEGDLSAIERGALLHDIGKIGVPDSILLKPGPLTPEEWTIMRYHPRYARELLERIPFLRESMDIPYCHHERWDGGGYPCGIAGEQIPLSARIFAVVDVYDALTSDRPYRPAWRREDALHYLVEQKGRQFEDRVVEAFLAVE